MSMLRYLSSCAGLAFILSGLSASTARAELFFIDASQSSLTMTLNILGEEFTPQGANANLASYFGTINATLTDPLSSATGITFNSAGTSITAGTSGAWVPDTSGDIHHAVPSNYGFQGLYTIFPALLATQEIAFTLSGSAGDQVFNFSAGKYYIDAGAAGNILGGEFAVEATATGNNTGLATYTPHGDGSGVLNIPINVSFTQAVDDGIDNGQDGVGTYTFSGNLRAVSVPEPSGALLGGLALGLLAGRRRRRAA